MTTVMQETASRIWLLISRNVVALIGCGFLAPALVAGVVVFSRSTALSASGYFWWFRMCAAVAGTVAGIAGAMYWAKSAQVKTDDGSILSTTQYLKVVSRLNWAAAIWTAVAVGNGAILTLLGLLSKAPFRI